MSPSIAIRRATEEDTAEIALLTQQLGYATEREQTHRWLQRLLASQTDLVAVAVAQSGGLAGWLQAHAAVILESGFRVEITGLVVASAYRRRGIGRALVAEAERWARGISAEVMVVRSNVQRAESHEFYPALGFSGTKTQKVYRKVLAKMAKMT